MRKLSVTVKGLAKDFNRRPVFRDIGFSISTGDSLAITGRNGSGKSTLSKILAGVLSPTRGHVQYSVDGEMLDDEHIKDNVGFVSPYLNLYDEFTAAENLRLLSNIRSNHLPANGRIEELLKLVELWPRRDDLVGEYSSGMKQRLKYAFALMHYPKLLILDEPTSNLDNDGTKMVQEIVKNQKKNGLLIVATNDKNESKWCRKNIFLKGSGGSAVGDIS